MHRPSSHFTLDASLAPPKKRKALFDAQANAFLHARLLRSGRKLFLHALHINLQGSRTSRSGALDCSPDDQTLTPAHVASAYSYDTLHQRGLNGEQMTINLVETDGSYLDDIQNYLSCINFKGHLSVVNVDGSPSDAEGESTLDIEMVAGLAPAASIKVYQTDGNADGDTWTQVNDELQHIIDDNTNNASAGSVVSISLGIDEADITSDDVNALDSSLQQLTKVEHMTVFVASGDCGAYADETFGDLSVSFPASDPCFSGDVRSSSMCVWSKVLFVMGYASSDVKMV